MIVARRLLIIVTCLFMAACGASNLYDVPPPPVAEKVRISFASVEVRDVSLPGYAAADQIAVRAPDGTLKTSSGVLWADAPERAVALELSQNLARLTDRRVASEPWPFEALPDARLDVRFSELVAEEAGLFKSSGQYFVAVADGRRERSGLFELAVPYDPSGGPGALAAARGQIILDLATFIAKNGLR